MPNNPPYTSASNPTGATAVPRRTLTNPYDANNHGSRVDHALLADSATSVSAVAWSAVTGKPSEFAPSSHIHAASDVAVGQLDDGRIAASNVTQHEAALTISASQLTETSTKKVMTDVERNILGTIETGATQDQTASEIEANYNAQVAAASQAESEAGTETAIRRFSPLRISQAIAALAAAGGAPAAHAASHASGGSDAVKLDDLAATDDNTDLDATASAHGLMSKLDKTKLDGIETGATEDQSNSEIKTAYETNADTNAFTDTEKTKLSGIEASATEDQTASEIESNYNAQVAVVTQLIAEAGTDTVVRRWTAQRVAQAIAALGGSGTVAKEIGLAVSNEASDLVAGTAKLTFRMPYAMTLTAVRASVTTAPTDATVIVDINENGTTILSTKLSIDATEKTSVTASSAAVISDTALADDAEITVDIDQIGSTVPGTGLKIWLIGTLT
jgi:hypothetical protein